MSQGKGLIRLINRIAREKFFETIIHDIFIENYPQIPILRKGRVVDIYFAGLRLT